MSDSAKNDPLTDDDLLILLDQALEPMADIDGNPRRSYRWWEKTRTLWLPELIAASPRAFELAAIVDDELDDSRCLHWTDSRFENVYHPELVFDLLWSWYGPRVEEIARKLEVSPYALVQVVDKIRAAADFLKEARSARRTIVELRAGLFRLAQEPSAWAQASTVELERAIAPVPAPDPLPGPFASGNQDLRLKAVEGDKFAALPVLKGAALNMARLVLRKATRADGLTAPQIAHELGFLDSKKKPSGQYVRDKLRPKLLQFGLKNDGDGQGYYFEEANRAELARLWQVDLPEAKPRG